MGVSDGIVEVYAVVEWKSMSSVLLENIVYLLELSPSGVLADIGDERDYGTSGTVLADLELRTWTIPQLRLF